MSDSPKLSFEQLGLPDFILSALKDTGYESPSPIQAQAIPILLKQKDLVGQAQTGTGKTAAFAFPALSQVDIAQHWPQALVLAPTRELAIQVAEAFQSYAHYLPGFHVLPIYGGQNYSQQIRALKRGVHVVVGTPGRIMDLMRRGVLDLSQLKFLVLDEADEMLRMGFIDDVEWILDQTPETRQTALFSATMPGQIRRIANQYLHSPEEVTIKHKTKTAANIRQRLWTVSGLHKLDALTRILETETFDAMIVFVRTKNATEELAEKLQARGFAASALNGDMVQQLRTRTVDSLKAGNIDILVATDVVARGLDVERITHVINYDIPYDSEAYIHRIGRTGRAGRKGEAILFAAPRERRMLRAIESATKQKFEHLQLPTIQEVKQSRIAKFKDKLVTHMNSGTDFSSYHPILEEIKSTINASDADIAVALIHLLQGHSLEQKDAPPNEDLEKPKAARDNKGNTKQKRAPKPNKKRNLQETIPMESFRLEVGVEDGVQAKHIVGAIANEAGIESQYIGSVDIHDNYSTVNLPQGMPKDIFSHLKKVHVLNKPLKISRLNESHQNSGTNTKESAKRKSKKSRSRKPKK